MAGRADEIDARQREAGQRRESAAVALAQLERSSASGEQVAAKTRTDAEAALAKAQADVAAPWAERRAGATAAIADADREMRLFIGANLDALLDELREGAEAAAGAVDRACQDLVAAYGERQRCERRVTSLAAMVRNPRAGDVVRTRAEAVAREASALLAQGGEAPPVLVVDPRQPRHGQVEEIEQPATVPA